MIVKSDGQRTLFLNISGREKPIMGRALRTKSTKNILKKLEEAEAEVGGTLQRKRYVKCGGIITNESTWCRLCWDYRKARCKLERRA